jgi:hypothetical protein
MARIVFDGNFKVFWLDTAPGDAAAPTVAEITAGTDITSFVPKDGFKLGVSNNRVSGGSLDESFLDESMGTWTSALAVDAYLDDTTNTAYETIGVRGATGAIVAIPVGGNVATKKAYVWPDVEAGTPIPMDTAENARQKFTAEFAVRQAPELHATIAA